jgi:hypothetical protein
MTRIGFAPVVGIVLAIAACGGILLLQERDAKNDDAQLALVRTENRLNQLQNLPWQVQNPQSPLWGSDRLRWRRYRLPCAADCFSLQ